MRREEQIKNMARAIHLNCHKGLTSTEAEMIAKWCYQEIDKKVSEIFEEIEEYILLEWNEEAYAELKKKYIGKDTNVTTNTEGER